MITTEQVRALVEPLIAAQAPGAALDTFSEALIRLAVRASVTTLDVAGCDTAIAACLDAGASARQVQEVLDLVSGLGVHTLMEATRRLAAQLRARGDTALDEPLDQRLQALWDKHVGDDPYWGAMEAEAPGFLDALLRLSPDGFEAFFNYCSVPWKSATLRPLLKELIAIAVDASTTHRYMPGLRLHLRNAAKLGAGRMEILQTLDIARGAPPHAGVA
ncbi:carboxymuconolactone decarboxylase family protein [Pseudoduganella namucuonensis]|uniref:Carboxymuconolactone decarboxylase family protein n=1 Tax=Pseudoduganella namucuonensis TaxID=1035707 RepID=A0A1I7KZJ9_9BURK|nr:carboxymuconolactone decarboxylase family protein [Pseudoduganella namucuonensis]SFV02724.1 Carboxymuconolactone decarboxylase family protein [Pseudoduganella namucuonensis]